MEMNRWQVPPPSKAVLGSAGRPTSFHFEVYRGRKAVFFPPAPERQEDGTL